MQIILGIQRVSITFKFQNIFYKNKTLIIGKAIGVEGFQFKKFNTGHSFTVMCEPITSKYQAAK